MTRPETALVDHLFRHESARMVASLTRIFGWRHLDLVEDVVQEALLAALRRWPYRGVPDNPTAWLVRVARNRALDAIRRDTMLRDKAPEVRAWAERAAAPGPAPEPDAEIRNDQLMMIFACCADGVPRDARIALTLKAVCGFSVPEIARAFLADEAAIAQRIVRAKRRIRALGIELTVPRGEAIVARLDSVLEVLYLLFNEGHTAGSGPALMRRDLVDEALRLARLLLEHPATTRPEVHAIASLFLLQAARLPGRVGPAGELLLLSEQDRATWDAALIAEGLGQLERARSGDALTTYHLQAGIAATHAIAPDFDATDWPQIVELYDMLARVEPSPVVALNRAVAVAMADGPAAGLAAIEPLIADPRLRRYALLPAVRGEILRRAGDAPGAAACFRRALELGGTEPERALLRARLDQASAGDPGP